MRLRRLAAELTDQHAVLLPILETVGLKATDHLVFTPMSTLHHLLDHSLDKASWELLEDIRAICIAIEAGTLSLDDASALDTPEQFAQLEADALDRHFQGFGVAGLDGLLTGFDGSGIIELVGAKSSGKTLLSLHLVLRHLLMDPLASCTWIDTEGAFSPERAAGQLEAMHVSDVLGVLGRVDLVTCVEVEDVRSALQGVAMEIAQAEETLQRELQAGQIPTKTVRPRVVVVDPASTILSPLLKSESGVEGYARMMTVMSELADIVRQHDLLCILTSHSVPCLPANISSAFTTTTIKPALGTSYALFPDVTLLIQRTREVFVLDEGEAGSERRVVEVLKRKDGPASTWSIFDTDGISLFDVLPG